MTKDDHSRVLSTFSPHPRTSIFSISHMITAGYHHNRILSKQITRYAGLWLMDVICQDHANIQSTVHRSHGPIISSAASNLPTRQGKAILSPMCENLVEPTLMLDGVISNVERVCERNCLRPGEWFSIHCYAAQVTV